MMGKESEQPVFIRNPQVESVELEGEWVLVHAGNRTVTKLNAWGGRIWELLARTQTPARITEELGQEGVSPGPASEREVLEFLRELRQLDVVTEEK